MKNQRGNTSFASKKKDTFTKRILVIKEKKTFFKKMDKGSVCLIEKDTEETLNAFRCSHSLRNTYPQ